MKRLILGAAAVALWVTQASAVTLSADTATASSEFSSGYLAVNTINGTGLSSNTAVGEAHADYAFGNHWTTAQGTDPLDAWISWGFNSGQDVGGIYIWNHRSNVISSNGGYEPILFDLEIFDSSNASLALFDDVALGANTAFAQAFNFGQVFSDVTLITFRVEAVESSPSYTGLAEVAFDTAAIAGGTALTAPVPLPGGMAMLGGALGLVAVWRWRKPGSIA